MGSGEKPSIRASCAKAQKACAPIRQSFRVGDDASLNRTLKPVAIGERANWERGGKPSLQAQMSDSLAE